MKYVISRQESWVLRKYIVFIHMRSIALGRSAVLLLKELMLSEQDCYPTKNVLISLLKAFKY